MPGPPPKKPDERRRRNAPAGGEWAHAPGFGWQHGGKPRCPAGLLESTRAVWKIWLESWEAAFWSADDLPALQRMIRLYDECERLQLGELADLVSIEDVEVTAKTTRVVLEFRQRPTPPHAELRQLMDRFGLNPLARQKLRWLPPLEGEQTAAGKTKRRYGHLEAV